ncbi:MAG: SPOR domain-containing protein [Methylococcales bacterium]|nr:SPOR domain-containing protein [Methylococcales bacterium]
MADSTTTRPRKTLDTFADDPPATLNIDENNDAHRVGDIGEEDTIDRLLVGNDFQDTGHHGARDEFTDHEAGIAAADDKTILGDIAITPGRDAVLIPDELTGFGSQNDRELVQNIDEISLPEVDALERVGDISDFLEPAAYIDTSIPEILSDSALASARPPAERDEKAVATAAEPKTVPEAAGFSSMQASQAHQPLAAEASDESKQIDGPSPAADAEKSMPEQAAKLAGLSEQVDFLVRQQQIFIQEIAEKADRRSMIKCQDEIVKLKSVFNSNPQNRHAPGSQKPIVAYIANAIATGSLLLAAGIGFQSFSTSTRLNDLQQTVAKLQEQAKTAPAGVAADQEAILKQLNELKAADSQTAGRIAEINKILQKNAASTKTDATLNKKMAALNSQNMQVDAKIEELQNKIDALKKKPPLTLAQQPAPKSETRKPAPAESWAVNLIAFKQDWFAKRKAEEYASKGIPAKVSKTEAKGAIWYRLSVDDFKTQAEAASYAAKVKKTLNLDSVGITHHQN